MAYRPLNRCGDCGYTWHPRGKNVSLACPACGSRNTKVDLTQAAGCCGCLLFFLILIPFRSCFHGREEPPEPAVSPAVESSRPLPTAKATTKAVDRRKK